MLSLQPSFKMQEPKRPSKRERSAMNFDFNEIHVTQATLVYLECVGFEGDRTAQGLFLSQLLPSRPKQLPAADPKAISRREVLSLMTSISRRLENWWMRLDCAHIPWC